MHTPPLANKVIVIVGGTTGLGLAAANACVGAGASVVVYGRDINSVTAAGESLGSAALALCGDASAPGQTELAIDAALEKFGRFDALYHVAGGSGRKQGDGPLDAIPDDGWNATLQINLTSVFYSNRAAVRTWLNLGQGGCVLNMASVLAYAPAPTYFATHAYATAKAGIIGLTRACAAYYARHNIRFNAVAPALVETPMSRRAAGDQTILDYVARRQPLDGGRIGQSDDLDGAVVYLLSDAARYVTGQVLAVDGGWSVSDAGPTP